MAASTGITVTLVTGSYATGSITPSSSLVLRSRSEPFFHAPYSLNQRSLRGGADAEIQDLDGLGSSGKRMTYLLSFLMFKPRRNFAAAIEGEKSTTRQPTDLS